MEIVWKISTHQNTPLEPGVSGSNHRWLGYLHRFVGHPSHFQRLPKAKNKCKNRSILVDTLTISGYGVGVMSEAQ